MCTYVHTYTILTDTYSRVASPFDCCLMKRLPLKSNRPLNLQHFKMFVNLSTNYDTYVRMCLCTYVHLCLCVYTCTYVRMYVPMYICTYICTYVHMYICTYICTYVCAYVHIHMYVRMYVPTYVHTVKPHYNEPWIQ